MRQYGPVPGAFGATVTVMVADIESSTALLERLGRDRWMEALAEYEALLSERLDEHGGRQVKSLGDGHLLAFAGARAAVRFAVSVQRALPVPAAADLRVRMGIHSGEPAAVGDDLHGRTVVKAARIAGLARGGEILVSTLVRELAATEDGLGTDAWCEEEREVTLRGMRGHHTIAAVRWEAEQRRATRVVVADDSAVVRDGVAAVLRENGIDVTATANDAESLYRAVNRHRPDVALVDIRMPPTGTDEGLVAAERLAESHPEMGVLVLSSHLEPGYALRIVEGCEARRGYLLKDRVADIEVLLEAIRRVARGGSFVDPAIVEELVGAAGAGGSALAQLTDGARQVLRLVAQGMSNAAIAEALGIAVADVEREVREIVGKLGLAEDSDEHTRVAAVLAYLEATAVGGA